PTYLNRPNLNRKHLDDSRPPDPTPYSLLATPCFFQFWSSLRCSVGGPSPESPELPPLCVPVELPELPELPELSGVVLALRSEGFAPPLVSISLRLSSMRASLAFTSSNSDVVTR